MKKSIIAVVFTFILISLISCGGGKKSRAINEACSEVKSMVYSACGEIPSISADILYENGRECIVVVSYDLPDLNWKGKKRAM